MLRAPPVQKGGHLANNRFKKSTILNAARSTHWLAIISFSVVVVLAHFSYAQNPTKLPAPTLESVPAADSVNVPELFAGFMDPFEYDPRGRRDPFAQPVEDKPVEQGLAHGPLLPLQRYDVNQLRLVGVLWDVRQPKAMLKDPEGHMHVIGPNAKVGPHNGYVAVIREGEIVVVESLEQDGRYVSTAQVVKIAK